VSFQLPRRFVVGQTENDACRDLRARFTCGERHLVHDISPIQDRATAAALDQKSVQAPRNIERTQPFPDVLQQSARQPRLRR
jgi:hypothetical protein